VECRHFLAHSAEVIETKSNRIFVTLPLVCALLTIALGLLTFVGWISGLSLLASVRAKYIPMAPSTALCFSFVGVGLLVRQKLPLLARVGALLVLALALAKLIELAGGHQFGIDAWFVRDPGLFGAVPTGRMAPMTALSFVLTAGGLFALTMRARAKFAGPLGALIVMISVVILVGYWYGTPLLYGGKVIPVALSTAGGFLLCGLAIATAAGIRGWPLRAFLGDSTRALLLRSFVPMIIVAALLNGWVNATLWKRIHVNPAVTTGIGAIVFAVLVTWIISQVSGIIGGRIDRAEAARRAAQAELVALNAELEARVERRTRQLHEKNAQMAEELQMARELQLALLPHKFPSVPANVSMQDSALRFLSWFFPTGDVSGDFFTVFPIGEKSVAVLICDVMGHGVRSALITSMIRGLVEEHAQAAADPGELLTRVNRALSAILRQAETTMFATCFYLVADVQRAELRFANAGHPSALHVRDHGTATEPLRADGNMGLALGILPSTVYATSCRPMKQGDLVMLFTDGLFEVEDATGNLFSQDLLQETVSRHAALPAQEFFGRVLADIRKFSRSETFDDDVCVVGMQVQHLG
jgi:serine phosphatase RsbU (regulator of sigma subunit)